MIKRKAFVRKPAKILRNRAKLPHKRRKPKKRPKQTLADFKRSWLMHPKAWMRYKGLKGVYWHYFSRSVRQRDYDEHGGLCMTCLTFVEHGDDQGGHLYPAANCGFALLFHPMNVHLQHSKCNNPRFTPQAGVFNTINIDKRYGAGTVEELGELRKQITPEWTKLEYEAKIKELPAYQKAVENAASASQNMLK